MKRRALVILCLVSILVGLLSFPVSAKASGDCGDNATWSLSSSGVLTISGSGDIRDCIYEGAERWPNIKAPWRKNAEKVKKIVIAPGITRIGDYAFCCLPNVTSVSIPDTVTSIGQGAFCYDGSLDHVAVPDSVETIEKSAFKKCSSLTDITLPKNLAVLEESTFKSCGSLSNIILPSKITKISYYVFASCGSLKSINLHEGITEIQERAFDGSGLTSIQLPTTLQKIGYGAFSYTPLKQITIPENVTYIVNSAFAGCDYLEYIQFLGDAPTFQSNIFDGTTTTAYYPKDNATWTKDVRQDYGGNITWVTASSVEVTTQPKLQKVKAGSTVKFTVKATGDGLKYQWQSSFDGEDWKDCVSSTTKKATFTFTAKTRHHSNYYRCKITDAAGNVTYTNTAGLFVLGITSQPKTQKIAAWRTVNFAVKATGDGLKYQWQSSRDGKTWKNCVSNSAEKAYFGFTAKSKHSSNYYRCKITDSKGNVIYTDSVRLYVLGITEQTTNKTVEKGKTVKMEVRATGASKVYQWQVSTDGGKTWKNCVSSSATKATFTFTGKDRHDGNFYRCQIKDSGGNTIYSVAAKLTVE